MHLHAGIITSMESETDTSSRFAYPRRWMAGLSLVFALVHAVYYGLGIIYNRGTLVEVMHFADPELLRTRLWETLWYLHIQPPLMNLFVGLVLKCVTWDRPVFMALYLVMGLTLYLSVFVLQVRLGVGKPWAAVSSTVFMASPSFILWENYLMYTLPCAALLAVAALCLFDVLERGSGRAAAGFFWALFALCAMRSMFHLGYFVLALGALLWCMKTCRRKILIAALVPLLLLSGLYAKNYVIFGEFGVCSFVGKNLWIMTAGNMRWADKARLIDEGKISPLSFINRWDSLDSYPAKFREVPPRFQKIPVLSQEHKTNGAVNYNHYGNIAINKIYGKDAWYVLMHQPRVYLLSLAVSGYRYFKSSSALPVSLENQVRISWITIFYDYAVYGKCPFDLAPYLRIVERTGDQPYFFLLIGLPLVWVHGLYRVFWPGRLALSIPQRGVLFFLCFTILMVAVLGCALDFTDGARYRFKTDAYSIALLGVLLANFRFRHPASLR